MKDGKGAQNNMECLLFRFIGTVDKDRGAEIKVLNFTWGGWPGGTGSGTRTRRNEDKARH